MSPASSGKIFIVAGLMLVAVGLLLQWGGVRLGRLPGDILIQRERFTLCIPITTCILLSALFSLVAWLFWRR